MNMNKTKIIIMLILRILCIILFPLSYVFDPTYSGNLTFFTVQSNIFVLLIMLTESIFDILMLTGKIDKLPKFLSKIKLVSTTSISITFIVFGIILTPVLIKEGLPEVVTSYSSIVMHQIIPIVAIIDLILSKPTEKISYGYTPLALTFPLYYYIFTLIVPLFGIHFKAYENGETVMSNFPYFFLDYEKNGWLRFDGEYMGVIYWLIIIILFELLVSAFYIFIKNLQFKKQNK